MKKVLAGAVFAALAVVFASQLPDLRRYLHMRHI